MTDCTICENPATFIEIDGGNYYCSPCILDMYGFITDERVMN